MNKVKQLTGYNNSGVRASLRTKGDHRLALPFDSISVPSKAGT